MFGAGVLSGLLGIGSGALKVIAMDRVMRIPFKVSTTTSNFMIGVTAAASAGIYLTGLHRSRARAARHARRAGRLPRRGPAPRRGPKPGVLRIVFALTIVFLGGEMIFNGLTGRL